MMPGPKKRMLLRLKNYQDRFRAKRQKWKEQDLAAPRVH